MANDDVIAEASRWLALAEEDMRGAEAMASEDAFSPRHVCWYSQQAAEKALKTVLVFEQVAFPFSHDLEQLRALVPIGWRVRGVQADLPTLSRWAIEGRYPDSDAPTDEDATAALTAAREVVATVASELRERGVE
jgi:HEPN domain-containing protein